MEWSNAQIYRETKHSIDIFIELEEAKCVVIIENKIWANETGDQLDKYYQWTKAHYPKYRILPIFLSPDGRSPVRSPEHSHHYLPVSYEVVSDILQDILKNYQTRLSDDILIALNHYQQHLTRHVLDESELKKKAKILYQKYSKAIDFIAENRPDVAEDVMHHIFETINESDKFEATTGMSRKLIHFVPKTLSSYSAYLTGMNSSWGTNAIFNFEIDNRNRNMLLIGVIGHGDNDVRQALFDSARNNLDIFSSPNETINPYYNRIYSRVLISRSTWEEGDLKTFIESFDKAWNVFIQNDFPQMLSHFEEVLSQFDET